MNRLFVEVELKIGMFSQLGPGGPLLLGRLKSSSSAVSGPGAEVTTAVGLELAEAEPAPFDAVTTTSTVEPTSLETSVYVDAVAPAIGVQVVAVELQSCHW